MNTLKQFFKENWGNKFVEESLKKVYKELLKDFNLERIEDLENLINDIIEVKGKSPNNGEFLRVIKFKDFSINENTKEIYYFDYYDVSLIKEENEEYSTLLIPFEEIIELPICEKSIKKYGIYNCVLSIMSRLTFLGHNHKEINKRIKEIKKELIETEKKLENGKKEFLSAEEVFGKNFLKDRMDKNLIKLFDEGFANTEEINKRTLEEFLGRN